MPSSGCDARGRTVSTALGTSQHIGASVLAQRDVADSPLHDMKGFCASVHITQMIALPALRLKLKSNVNTISAPCGVFTIYGSKESVSERVIKTKRRIARAIDAHHFPACAQ